jgi:hypothetical protein
MQNRYKNSLSLDIDPIENEPENEEPEMVTCNICGEIVIIEESEFKHFSYKGGEVQKGSICLDCILNQDFDEFVFVKERN